jgi:hypothetical protein
MIPHPEPTGDLSRTTPTKTGVGLPGRVSRVLGSVAPFVAAALFGVFLAVIAQYLFFVEPPAWLNLVVWTIIAVSVGMTLRTWAMTISICAVIGFSIVFTYSMTGYHANAPLLAAVPLFALLAIAGAIGMAAGGAIGHLLRRLGNHSPSTSRRVIRTKDDEGREAQK